MIYIRTSAYNSAATLRRAVESVLDQTCGDFVYYLVDNGSTDGGKTRAIVEEYAKRDSRIRPFFNPQNDMTWEAIKEANDLPFTIGDEDSFCILDSDDEYEPDFFRSMLDFMGEYDLDIAACGGRYVYQEEVKKIICLPMDLILHDDLFLAYFPYYHWYMRNVWGKLFKGKTLRHIDLENVLYYGNDTKFSMNAFSHGKRVGIYSGMLHINHVRMSSTMYQFNPERIRCDQILNDLTHEFLGAYGRISSPNEIFLQEVFLNACMSTLALLLQSKTDPSAKLHLMMETLCYPYVTNIVKELRREKEHFLRDARRQVIGGLHGMARGWIAEHREELPASDRWIGDSLPHRLEI